MTLYPFGRGHRSGTPWSHALHGLDTVPSTDRPVVRSRVVRSSGRPLRSDAPLQRCPPERSASVGFWNFGSDQEGVRGVVGRCEGHEAFENLPRFTWDEQKNEKTDGTSNESHHQNHEHSLTWKWTISPCKISIHFHNDTESSRSFVRLYMTLQRNELNVNDT